MGYRYRLATVARKQSVKVTHQQKKARNVQFQLCFSEVWPLQG